ncbi:MAG: hypothetical protein K2G53_00015, partial [Muribaculaceae bacterium]|nr:hypothetical protein [Muribaculaceae bacterium]
MDGFGVIYVRLLPEKAKLYEFVDTDLMALNAGSNSYNGTLNDDKSLITWDLTDVEELKPRDVSLDFNWTDSDLPPYVRIYWNIGRAKVKNKVTGEIKMISEIDSSIAATVNINNYSYITKYHYLGDDRSNNWTATQQSYIYPSRESEPNTYPLLGGKYGVTVAYKNNANFMDKFIIFENYYNERPSMTAKIYKEDGTLVDSYDLVYDSDPSFYFIMDKPITENGRYYIVYDVKGRCQGWDPKTQTQINGVFVNNIKTGPYIVDNERATRVLNAQLVDNSMWDSTIYTDALPDQCAFQVSNAEMLYLTNDDVTLRCVCPNKTTINFNADIVCNGNNIIVPLENLKQELNKSGSIPAGSYTIYIDTPKDIFSGLAPNRSLISFANRTNISKAFKLTAPAPASTLGAYIEKSGSTVQLEKGESVKVKLGTAAANDSKIFVKWTKA